MPLVCELNENYKLDLTCLNKRTGFVGAYLADKNKPYLEHCIFLMYEFMPNTTAEQYRTFLKLYKLDNLYDYYTYKIKGKHYRIFVLNYMQCLNNLKYDLKYIKSGQLEYISLINKHKISVFYNDNSLFVNLYKENLLQHDIDTLPEKDYVYDLIGNE